MAKQSSASQAGTQTGLVIQSFGRRYSVETEDGILSCVTRGKKTDVVCGDQVQVRISSPGEGVIEDIDPRHSLLYRQDEWRIKSIAANVSQIIVVTAAVPACHEAMLNRCLVASEAAGIPCILLLNKADLPESPALQQRLARYEQLGYRLLVLSAKQDAQPLRALLQGQTSVLVGQSGMGKSTLVNALLPEASARTGDISTALNSGKHTTTYATLYHLDAQSRLIDSPGMQVFGLHQIEARQLAECFPEFRPHLGQCRFNNCWHRVEPGCAVAAAAERGEIDAARLAFYRELLAERENSR